MISEKMMPVIMLLIIPLLLGISYGLFMGLYAILTREPACYEQLFASAVKVPALFPAISLTDHT